MAAVRSFNRCLYCQKLHQFIRATDESQFVYWYVGMSAISCQKIISYKGIKIKVSKLSFDTLFILCSVEVAWRLNFLHSIQFGEKISYTSTKLMCSDFWWFLMNVISKYLFLEQFCQFSEGVLKFLSEAGDSIHSFSSCTHTGALKTEWKCRISLKSAYLYTSNVQWVCTPGLINLIDSL